MKTTRNYQFLLKAHYQPFFHSFFAARRLQLLELIFNKNYVVSLAYQKVLKVAMFIKTVWVTNSPRFCLTSFVCIEIFLDVVDLSPFYLLFIYFFFKTPQWYFWVRWCLLSTGCLGVWEHLSGICLLFT